MPNDEVPHALFEDALPTPSEVRAVLSAGYGVHLVEVPDAGRNLRFLLEFVGLTHLGVVGVGLDTRVIGELGSLQTLELTVGKAPETDLSALPALRKFSGLLHPNESVWRCPALEVASFQDVREGAVPPVPAQLRELSLRDAQKTERLAPGGEGSQLTSLLIDRTRSFDVESLRAFPALERIFFDQVRSLVNIEALLDLPIRELGLTGCHSIDNPGALRDLRSDATIGVTGRLSTELRGVAEDSSAHWEFYRS